VFFLSFRINKLQAGTAMMLFMPTPGCWDSCCRRYFSPIPAHRSPVLLHLGGVVRALSSTATHAARSFADRLVPDHGLFGLILASIVNIFLEQYACLPISADRV